MSLSVQKIQFILSALTLVFLFTAQLNPAPAYAMYGTRKGQEAQENYDKKYFDNKLKTHVNTILREMLWQDGRKYWVLWDQILQSCQGGQTLGQLLGVEDLQGSTWNDQSLQALKEKMEALDADEDIYFYYWVYQSLLECIGANDEHSSEEKHHGHIYLVLEIQAKLRENFPELEEMRKKLQVGKYWLNARTDYGSNWLPTLREKEWTLPLYNYLVAGIESHRGGLRAFNASSLLPVLMGKKVISSEEKAFIHEGYLQENGTSRLFDVFRSHGPGDFYFLLDEAVKDGLFDFVCYLLNAIPSRSIAESIARKVNMKDYVHQYLMPPIQSPSTSVREKIRLASVAYSFSFEDGGLSENSQEEVTVPSDLEVFAGSDEHASLSQARQASHSNVLHSRRRSSGFEANQVVGGTMRRRFSVDLPSQSKPRSRSRPPSAENKGHDSRRLTVSSSDKGNVVSARMGRLRIGDEINSEYFSGEKSITAVSKTRPRPGKH